MGAFDVCIIGKTVEGLSAAIYCCRNGLKTIVVDNNGFEGGSLEELKLIHRLKEQAEEKGTHFTITHVHSLWPTHSPKIVYTEGKRIECKCIIIATGVAPHKLGLPLETHFRGCGLHYHNSCTSSYLKNKVVSVYGANQESLTFAITLSDLCKQVYFIWPDSISHCSIPIIDVLYHSSNIQVLPHTLINNIRHKNRRFIGVEIVDKTTGNKSLLDCEILYISCGISPCSKLCFPYISTDEEGFILTNNKRATNVPGIFAAGKVCSHYSSSLMKDGFKHTIFMNDNMAATDGAIAAINAIDYIKNMK